MTVSVESARYNLRTAARNVADRLDVDPRAMTYDQRRAYNRALAAEILKYPQSFTPEIVAIAGNIRDQGPLADSAFAFGDLAAEAAGAAATVLGGFTNKLLWIVALGVVAWLFFNSRPPAARAA